MLESSSGKRLQGDKVTIGYIPLGQAQYNSYAKRCVEILGRSYEMVAVPRSRTVLKSLVTFDFRRIDVAVTNWEDNWIVGQRSGRLSFLGTLNFLARLLVLRLLARRVIYVRHNRFPHHTSPMHARAARRALDLLERLSTCVVTHSPCEATRSRRYVPHPLYLDPGHRSMDDGIPEEPYFIVLGRLARYKGIESLVTAFPEGQRLLLVGPCEDDEYLRELQSLCGDRPGIELHPRFVDDTIASTLVSRSRAMIIASEGDDMIVSGSYFFALSNATPVIAMESEFNRWSIDVNNAPGLLVCATVDEMASVIRTYSSPDRTAIASYALSNFGDEVVARAWAQVIEPKSSRE